jgi:two-component system chemotaxis response regulator CheB
MKKINVSVVEDSKTARLVLKKVLEEDPQISVLAFYESAEEALLELDSKRPDVLLVDINLPGINGYELTKKVMQSNPLPVFIITATTAGKEAEYSFKAMEVGALSVFEKPKSAESSTAHFLRSIKMASTVRLKPLKTQTNLPSTERYEAVAIGGSLGGPQALKEILCNLQKNFPVPIFVVQHISRGFSEMLVKWLQGFTALKVVLAKEGLQPTSGHVYIAPDDSHMTLDKNKKIHLVIEPNELQLQPSVAKLFESMSNVYGEKGIGVILTGMGKDGAKQLLDWKKKGGLTIAQNESSSICYGMPKEAIDIGGAKMILSLDEIAPTLNQLIEGVSSDGKD